MPERGRVESGAWVRTCRCADLLMVCQRIGGVESVVRRKHSGVWVIPERGRVESGAWDRSCRRADLVKLGQRIGGVESVVRGKRNGGWEVSDRLSYAIGEKSIDFLKILYRLFRISYRLFPDTSIQTLGGHESNDLTVWKHRSAHSVEKNANVRGNRDEMDQAVGRFVRNGIYLHRRGGSLEG